MLKLFSIALSILIFSSCKPDILPKQKAYPRVKFPHHQYQTYTSSCPFTFEYPIYTTIVQDSLFFGTQNSNNCWFDIDFKDLSGKIHLSYYKIDEKNSLEKLLNDAHKLTFKHSKKANYIDEKKLEISNDVYGILFEVGGDAASTTQFYLTDRSSHFLRGALYFNTAPNADSLQPVVKFVRKDMEHMIKSFRWKK